MGKMSIKMGGLFVILTFFVLFQMFYNDHFLKSENFKVPESCIHSVDRRVPWMKANTGSRLGA